MIRVQVDLPAEPTDEIEEAIEETVKRLKKEFKQVEVVETHSASPGAYSVTLHEFADKKEGDQ